MHFIPFSVRFTSRQKFTLAIFSGVIYAIGFWFLLPIIGLFAGGLALLPLIIVGFLCGKKGALFSMMGVFILGTSILIVRGYDLKQPDLLLLFLIGNFFLILCAFIIGWTNSLLYETHQQYQSLELERANLKAEIEKRKEIEKNLRQQQEFNQFLQESILQFSSEKDLPTVLTQILEKFTAAIHCDSVTILIEENRSLIIQANAGHPEKWKILGRKLDLDRNFNSPGCRVYRERSPLNIQDVCQDADWGSLNLQPQIHSWLGVPLILKDKTIGIITVDRFTVNPFTPTEILMVETLARPLALIIENLGLFQQAQIEIDERRLTAEKLEKRLQSEALISSFTTQLINTDLMDIKENIQKILEDLGEFTGSDRCYFAILSEDKASISQDYLWISNAVTPRPLDQQLNSLQDLHWFREQLLHSQTIQIDNIQHLGRYANAEKKHCEQRGIQSLLIIPVSRQQKLLGFLGFQSETRQINWQKEDILLLQLMANIFSSFWSRRSAEKKSLEKLLFVERIIDAIPAPVFYINTVGEYLGCNLSFSEYYGVNKEDLIGKTAYDFNDKQTADALLAMDFHIMKTATPIVYETPSVSADGSQHTLIVRKAPFFDLEGDVAGLIATMSDITERKDLEIALQNERSSLAEKVKLQTRELVTANQELAQASRAKDEFLAAMSHELRTPLNAILGLSEALQEHIYGPLNDKQMISLSRINESGDHLLSLITDILDLAKIGAGRLELTIQPVEASHLCQSSLDMIRQNALEKKLIIEISLDPQVTIIQVDHRRIKQVLLNILSNAIKFTPSGGKIGLELRGDSDTGMVHFIIWDTGIGISEEQIYHIFKPFQQIDSSLARQYDGAGLGLALAAQMTALHNGNIDVESKPGEGSRFTVSIPWSTSQQVLSNMTMVEHHDQTAVQQVRKEEHSNIILIAEDNPSNLETLADYLNSKGYQIATARNGKEAVENTKRLNPSLIIMDIQMPVMDGLEAIRKIRDTSLGSITPIIALTALAMPGDKEQCLLAGATEYLIKPIQLNQLAAIIRQLINHNEGEK